MGVKIDKTWQIMIERLKLKLFLKYRLYLLVKPTGVGKICAWNMVKIIWQFMKYMIYDLGDIKEYDSLVMHTDF